MGVATLNSALPTSSGRSPKYTGGIIFDMEKIGGYKIHKSEMGTT